jgi:UDP-2-acetamido-3-amino-2,3-dideoxy-glucuronate N-acetyltransferase
MKILHNVDNTCIISYDCGIADNVIIYPFCNIYNKTVIAKNCKIGAYTEISGAVIERDVIIGAKCFIPKGVTIKSGAWIGPGVFFTHSFPPCGENDWLPIVIEEGAMVGANVTIKEGVIIGKNAKIGCGSVVIHNVPDNEIWVGNPAHKIEKRGDS